MKPFKSASIQKMTTEQSFPEVLFIMLTVVVLTMWTKY